MTVRRTALLTAAAILTTTAASAGSLAMKKVQRDEDKKYAESALRTSEECGVPIKARIDYASFKEEDALKYAMAMSCDVPLFVLWTSCHYDELAKAEIAKQVKTVVCKFAGPGKSGIALKDGTVEYSLDFENGGNEGHMREVLEKQL